MFPVGHRLWFWLGLALLGLNPAAAGAATSDLFPRASTTDFPRVGIPFTIELHLANGGPDTVHNAVLTDVLPPQWSLVSCEILPYLRGFTIGTPYDPNAIPPSWTNYGNTVVCEGGTIYGHYYRTYFLTVVANQPGTYSHPVSVSAPGVFDPWSPNNQMNHAITVHTNGLFVFAGQSVSEAAGTSVVFTVTLSPANTVPVTVDFMTGGGTATAGQDYQFVSGTLTFAPGEINQTVSVPILDDALAEVDSQSFTLLLTNPINAELSGQAQFSFVLDDEPDISIAISNAAPVVEGNGETNLSFPVSLSLPCDVPLSVAYSTTDAMTTSGTLIIPAGVTEHSLSISVIGNLVIQSNRTVTATLADPSPIGVIVGATAAGDIVEDDGLPGNFDHLTISTVLSPQIVGRPFTVTLAAFDAFNQPATNYVSDSVSVSAYRIVGYSVLFEQTVMVTDFTNGVGTATFTFANASTNSRVVAWKPVGTGLNPVGTPQFIVITPPQLTITGPTWAGESSGVLPAAGNVTLPGADGQDVTIQLSTSDPEEILVPPSVFIPAGQTSAVFDVTVVDDARLDGPRYPQIIASATGYVAATSTTLVLDNETAVLGLTLPAGLSEAKGNNSGMATVTASAAPAFPILVSLLSSNPSVLTVPGGIYIQAGQTSVTFTVTAPDDTVIDGPQLATVSAHVTNWTSAEATTTVLDDDTNVSLNLFFGNASPVEGKGTVTNALQVRLGGFTSNDVVVQLISSDTTEVILPPAVLIPAGQQFATTNLTLPDDNEMDGTQTVTLTGVATGFLSIPRLLNVPDNDVHHFTFSTITSPKTSGVPFFVTVQVKDVNDVTMSNFREQVLLDAVHEGRTYPVTPNLLTNPVRGGLSSNVIIHHWGTNLQLRATSTNGTASLSNPFTIPTPAWAENLRISHVQSDGMDLVLDFPSATGRVYQVEVATNLTGTIWRSVGAPQPGTGSELSVRDTNALGQAMRLYRLAVPVP